MDQEEDKERVEQGWDGWNWEATGVAKGANQFWERCWFDGSGQQPHSWIQSHGLDPHGPALAQVQADPSVPWRLSPRKRNKPRGDLCDAPPPGSSASYFNTAASVEGRKR